MISSWLRAIRIRFLLASVIAVTTGLTISYWRTGQIDPFSGILTYVGVVFLHASVDLLNDYWDHRRGIDSRTTRTKFSGGTGVLPEELLGPRAVYSAGIVFLILGAAIGTYFVVTKGITVAIILGFAVAAIYFYSTSIVNAGLGELFVAIKGAMIVLGTFYVQTTTIDPAAAVIGIIVGLLSASVLFINAFPDYAADKSGGRRTLVIVLGRRNAARVFPLFFIAAYGMIVASVLVGYATIYALISLGSFPLALRALMQLRGKNVEANDLVPAMASTIMYSRVTGFLLAFSFLL
ncbi:MAG TPA: prenyltransferase [Nitrososphaera sp.]|nr:prenyltransferase [Nitrososphaera sp.]